MCCTWAGLLEPDEKMLPLDNSISCSLTVISVLVWHGCTLCYPVQKGVPEPGDLERSVFVGTQLVGGAWVSTAMQLCRLRAGFWEAQWCLCCFGSAVLVYGWVCLNGGYSHAEQWIAITSWGWLLQWDERMDRDKWRTYWTLVLLEVIKCLLCNMFGNTYRNK